MKLLNVTWNLAQQDQLNKDDAKYNFKVTKKEKKNNCHIKCNRKQQWIVVTFSLVNILVSTFLHCLLEIPNVCRALFKG